MNSGWNQLPNWIQQHKDCVNHINRLVYEFGVPVNFKNCMKYVDWKVNAARFAAMCMQVYNNGRPSQFSEVRELKKSDLTIR